MDESKSSWRSGFLPNGERTEDADLFVKEWNELGNSLKPLGLNMKGFNDIEGGGGIITFSYIGEYGYSIILPVALVNDLRDHIEAMNLLAVLLERAVPLPTKRIANEIRSLLRKWRGK